MQNYDLQFISRDIRLIHRIELDYIYLLFIIFHNQFYILSLSNLLQFKPRNSDIGFTQISVILNIYHYD